MSKKFASRLKSKAWRGNQKPSHRYRRRKVKLDIQRDLSKSRSHEPLSSPYVDAPQTHLHPYMDSASWLYLDPNVPVTSAPYALPPPCRTNHRHHRHHRHDRHHRHHRHRNYGYASRNQQRKVSSEPGTWKNAGAQRRHRRVCSMDDKMDCALEIRADASEEDFREIRGLTKTSTFRKVPWHPNLHMLKIRRA